VYDDYRATFHIRLQILANYNVKKSYDLVAKTTFLPLADSKAEGLESTF
jgi:hypothetical protein